MLKKVAGIQKVHRVYIELLYKCNLRCKHCFHGSHLDDVDTFSLDELKRLILLFKQEYDAETVVFLGGEPFLYKDLPEACQFAKSLGLSVEIVTNGYRIRRMLSRIGSHIDTLRVSIEGLETANDLIRGEGTFRAAIETLKLAQSLGIQTAVILTLTRVNLDEVIPLIHLLVPLQVVEMKLHPMRILGNAAANDYLCLEDPRDIDELWRWIASQRDELPMRVQLDQGRILDPEWKFDRSDRQLTYSELERIEIQPNGDLYSSCLAVGAGPSHFYFDKVSGQIRARECANEAHHES